MLEREALEEPQTVAALGQVKPFFDAMSGTESDSHSSSVGMQDISLPGPTLKDGYDAMLLRTPQSTHRPSGAP
jgi:hypothetical protein